MTENMTTPALNFLPIDTAPDADGLVLSVTYGGVKIGTLHCIHLGRKKLGWFGKNAAETASGGTYDNRAEAAADVLAWHEGRSPQYVQHAVVPLSRAASSLPWLQSVPNYIPCNDCGACYAGEACSRH